MKMHKLEVYVVDFENSGIDDCIAELHNNRYFNFNIMESKTTDIGEWDDDHKFNSNTTPIEEYRKAFE